MSAEKRRSSRLEVKRNRDFRLPDRDEYLASKDIITNSSSIVHLSRLTPKRKVNNLMKGTNRYNCDIIDVTDSEASLDSFIDDTDEEMTSSDSNESLSKLESESDGNSISEGNSSVNATLMAKKKKKRRYSRIQNIVSDSDSDSSGSVSAACKANLVMETRESVNDPSSIMTEVATLSCADIEKDQGTCSLLQSQSHTNVERQPQSHTGTERQPHSYTGIERQLLYSSGIGSDVSVYHSPTQALSSDSEKEEKQYSTFTHGAVNHSLGGALQSDSEYESTDDTNGNFQVFVHSNTKFLNKVEGDPFNFDGVNAFQYCNKPGNKCQALESDSDVENFTAAFDCETMQSEYNGSNRLNPDKLLSVGSLSDQSQRVESTDEARPGEKQTTNKSVEKPGSDDEVCKPVSHNTSRVINSDSDMEDSSDSDAVITSGGRKRRKFSCGQRISSSDSEYDTVTTPKIRKSERAQKLFSKKIEWKEKTIGALIEQRQKHKSNESKEGD